MHWWNISPAAIRQGLTLGEGILLTRELVNLPANLLYPEEFARRAAEVAVSCGLELEVWDELRLRKERCSALLAVAAGSARAPRLLVLRYRGKRTQPPLALVGKGVTFDSGGLSIKPTEGMLSMKCDMAGAATVLGAMQVLAELQVETPVVAVVGLVENMISGSSYKLGDVLTARSGKTIEIHNTDAEGRLVLADALNVALDESPAAIIDLATLTGACLVALGADIAGLMGNDPAWQQRVQSAAERAGEYVWPLPMHDHFREQIQSKVADIKNVGEGRWGGAITAAKFLQEFVGNTPWAHIDIAGPAFLSAPKPHIDAGATGAFVHTLLTLAEDFEPI
jgi:leucyl aminopeptidase